MSKENQNKSKEWKSKLDDLDSLPDETVPDKNEVWEKLYARLGGKKRSRKAVWYWAAAACILISLMIPSLYFKTNKHQVSTSQIEKSNTESDSYPAKSSSKKSINEKDSTQNIQRSMVINNRIKKKMVSAEKIRKNIDEKKMNKFRLHVTVSTQNILPETKSNSLTPMDTFSSLATFNRVKKKLKVVHINELGDPVETLPGIVRNADKHSFEFKIADQGIYINPATASNTSGFTILKIRSSQN